MSSVEGGQPTAHHAPANNNVDPNFDSAPLSAADQVPSGKEVGKKGARGQTIHQTGISRHTEANGVESFRASPGGQLTGASDTARSEAFFTGNTAGKSFSASYQVNADGPVTIFQQFNSQHGPNLRVTVDPDGSVMINTGTGEPILLGKIKPGEKFNLHVQDLGNGQSTFTLSDANGGNLGSATVANNRYGASDAFRYGAYLQYGAGEGGDAQVIVSDVQTDLV